MPREELLSISQHISNSYLAPEPKKTEVFLAEIDPHKVHASWSICKDDYESAMGCFGAKAVDKQPVVAVRLYDVTSQNLSGAAQVAYTDVEVQGLSNNWYIDLKKPACSFVADIGLSDPTGKFVRLATSNRIHTPPAGPSPMATYVHVEVGKSPVMMPVVTPLVPATEETIPAAPKKPSGDHVRVDHYAWLPPAVSGRTDEERVPFVQEGRHEQRDAEKRGSSPAVAAAAAADASPAKEEAGKEQDQVIPGSQQEQSASSPVGSSWMSGVGLGCSAEVQEVRVEVRISGRAAPNKEIILYGKKVMTDAEGCFSVQAQVPVDSWVMPILMEQILPDHGERG